MNDENRYDQIVHRWLIQFVINLNICPFAKKPYDEGKIRISHSLAKSDEEIWNDTFDEIETIKNHPDTISNTILSFPKAEQGFYSFFDLEGAIVEALEASPLKGEFQLVTFHPGFHFQDTDGSNPIDLVNRSPYPMFHILRTSEVTQARELGLQVNKNNEKKLTIREWVAKC